MEPATGSEALSPAGAPVHREVLAERSLQVPVSWGPCGRFSHGARGARVCGARGARVCGALSSRLSLLWGVGQAGHTQRADRLPRPWRLFPLPTGPGQCCPSSSSEHFPDTIPHLPSDQPEGHWQDGGWQVGVEMGAAPPAHFAPCRLLSWSLSSQLSLAVLRACNWPNGLPSSPNTPVAKLSRKGSQGRWGQRACDGTGAVTTYARL